MATAAPHVKLLRQLASAKDDYLSGAFDISWDGAKATLYLVFGRPSHAVFDTDQAQIEGEAAIDALLSELPRTFVVSDWRRAMSPRETLSITIDELAGPFVRLAGSYADDPVTDATPEWWSADDSSPDLAFGLADFPLLPGGRPLWEETSPEDVNLGERLAELPPSILVLTGAKLRAAAVVSGGDLIDAVWIDADDQARGEAAGMAILGATKGSLSGYALDDPRVAEALTMLWRLPLAVKGIELSWLDPASMLAAFHSDGLDRVLLIDAPIRGVAIFSRGGLVAVYSETQRSAVASPERLRSLLSQARGRLTVMERKPRRLAIDATDAQPSATEFFAVAADHAALPEELTVEPAGDEDAAGALVVAADADTTVDASAPLPPPLPPETGLAASADVPTSPAETATTSEPAPKRPWWAFLRSRRDRHAPSPPQDAEPVAPDATSFGWNVRRPEDTPKPYWYRREGDPNDSDEASSNTVPPAIEAEVGPQTDEAAAPPAASPVDETVTDFEAAAPANTSSVDEPVADLEAVDEPSPADAPESQVAHDFWSEFATPDPDSDADQAIAEPSALAASEPDHPEAHELAETEPDDVETEPHDVATEPDDVETQLDDVETVPDDVEPADTEPPPIAEERQDSDREPVVPEGLEPFRRRSSERTFAPWSWPLAEAESVAAPASTTASSTSPFHLTDAHVQAAASPKPASAEQDPGADEGFFQRDEPVGSQFVDFEEVRKELVRIGVVWLGESNAVPVTALLASTRSTIDDFVATIDAIRGLNVEGQEPASIQAMAREMHQQAAERLCGA
jgi:hypothetical protein